MTAALKPFRIGGVEVGFPVVLAALAGYSDLAYRLICRRLGAEYCTTEMMLDRVVLHRRKLRIRLLRLTDEDHPVAGQIIGNDPAEMADKIHNAENRFHVLAPGERFLLGNKR